ncbi:uncharacterized protein KGF55_000931 [Candida pseudojiufengensis]|uniref:uncharacterized protein n=1 Tax=Candida pseudojiufengensis TaxID=497109 RepID=UPI0022246C5D|nr:uncharacterized protein KGF55_000931 [Candida pseudojiufengensis]KAI5965569.1 hypothetical protein KGF55_000931 [Candida pseudojiufengensis]
MAKRKIPIDEIEAYEEEDIEYQEEDEPPATQSRKRSRKSDVNDDIDLLTQRNNNNQLHSESDKLDDINKVVKLLLLKDVKGKTFRKENINQTLTNKRFKSDHLLQGAIKILEDVYGLTLVNIPEVKQEKSGSGLQNNRAKKSNSGTAQASQVLVNNLSIEGKQVLGELWQKNVESVLDKSRTNDNRFFLPSKSSTLLPKSNFELVKTGIMMLFITFIILEDNHLSESQLVKNCKKFGISNSINNRNSNLNMNLDEIIKMLINQKYIAKVSLSQDRNNERASINEDQLFEYSLGARSLVEFTPIDVFQYIKTIYADKFNEAIQERCLVTLRNTFGVEENLLDGNSGNEPGNEIADDAQLNGT